MKTGDIIRLTDDFAQMDVYPDMFKLYIVRKLRRKTIGCLYSARKDHYL